MNLVSLTRVRIEGDVIEEFVRHTARLVDHLFVADNMSPDATRRILFDLQSEGLPITILDDRAIADAGVSTRLARHVFAESAADYVLCLDADEFVKALSREHLERVLSQLPPGLHAAVPMETYVPTPRDDEDEERVLARIRYRRRDEAVDFSKVFLARSFVSNPAARLAQGNHFVRDDVGEVQMARLASVTLAHFPVRNVKQMQNKAFLGWNKMIAMGLSDSGLLAYQWKRAYEMLRESSGWTAEQYFDLALRYMDVTQEGDPSLVYDPMPPVPRNYESPVPEPAAVMMTFAEQLGREYAELRTQHEQRRSERAELLERDGALK